MGKVVVVATLDTKGREVAYLRDRLNSLGVETVVLDSGILGEPEGIVPDVSNAELAARDGGTLAELRAAGSRGKAVARMRAHASDWVREHYRAGELVGGISVGGVGAVIGAAAIQELPIGVPKIVVAPTASGHHEFGPYVGTKDVMVVHSVVDILGVSPTLTAVFDNVAAAMHGMLQSAASTPRPSDDRYVALTMLGNTTTAVGAARERLADHGYESVVFHSNGVGGPAMEELAAEGRFVGVLDYTTNEIYDPLVGGIHDGGPNRLRTVGRSGVPQVLVPACIDFSVWASSSVPAELRSRPSYDHNPEYTLVRASHDEKAELGRIFAERVGESTAPALVIMPMRGLSLPATPDGPFWDPEGDAIFLAELRAHLRDDIAVRCVERHADDPELGTIAADALAELIAAARPESIDHPTTLANEEQR